MLLSVVLWLCARACACVCVCCGERCAATGWHDSPTNMKYCVCVCELWWQIRLHHDLTWLLLLLTLSDSSHTTPRQGG